MLHIRVVLQIRQGQAVLEWVNQRVQCLEEGYLVFNIRDNQKHFSLEEHMREDEQKIFEIEMLHKLSEMRCVDEGQFIIAGQLQLQLFVSLQVVADRLPTLQRFGYLEHDVKHMLLQK